MREKEKAMARGRCQAATRQPAMETTGKKDIQQERLKKTLMQNVDKAKHIKNISKIRQKHS